MAKFRRLWAQAQSMDKAELTELIERILPRAEGGKRILRLKTEADRLAAPMVIVGAFSLDALPGDEALALMQEAENATSPEQTPGTRSWSFDDPEIARMSFEERKQKGYVIPLEEHPLRQALLMWRAPPRWPPK